MDARTDPAPGTPPDPAPPGIDLAAMAAQLQRMIDEVARVTAPALRDVAVKAAELAAVAGERAGPVARDLAERTGEAGHAVAVRATAFASAHRAPPAPPAPPPAGSPEDAPG